MKLLRFLPVLSAVFLSAISSSAEPGRYARIAALPEESKIAALQIATGDAVLANLSVRKAELDADKAALERAGIGPRHDKMVECVASLADVEKRLSDRARVLLDALRAVDGGDEPAAENGPAPQAEDAPGAEEESAKGVLEFKLVHPRSHDLTEKLLASGTAPSGFVPAPGGDGYVQDPEAEALGRPLPTPVSYRSFGNPPAGFVFALEPDDSTPGLCRPLFVERLSRMGNADVRRVSVEEDPFERTALDIAFTKEGSEQFARLTAQAVNRRLAICVDGIVLSSPVIREAVTGGHAWISGSFSRKEAEEFAKRLSPASESASSLFDGILDQLR